MAPAKRIAVIGAGSQGLTAIKALKEEGGMDPVCFEKTGELCGLWRYRDGDVDGLASVMKGTVINSSKEMSAISDFPPPDDAGNYMHNIEISRMLEAYADKFDLKRHVNFYQEVTEVRKADDYDETGRLLVTVRDTRSGHVTRNVFDAVVVCTGHHVYPHEPRFPGQELFQGIVLHSHSLKRASGFEDRVVVVVGTGNSGMDAAVEIGAVAKQVYLSSRRGFWVLPRLGPRGLPLDLALTRRWLQLLSDLLPDWVSNGRLEALADSRCDHRLFGLRPSHRLQAQHPSLSDALPLRLAAGTVRKRGHVTRFVERGVLFEGEAEVTPCDVVVLATGYVIRFPFLAEDLAAVKDNEVHLYKYVFPPSLKHPSMAIGGLVQAVGGGFPIFEAHSRWIAQVFKGNVRLPSKEAMEADIARKRRANAKRYVHSQRHTIQADYIPYLDDIYSEIGAKPNLFRLLFTDPVLFLHVFFGPSLPYQYRLQGPHPWPGARKAILECNKRIARPFGGTYEGGFVPFEGTFLFVFVGGFFVVLLLVVVAFYFGKVV